MTVWHLKITTTNPFLVGLLTQFVEILGKQFSMTEFKYVFSRQDFYENMLGMSCSEEFLMNSDIFSLSMPLQILDYLFIVIAYSRLDDLHKSIVFDLLDNYTVLDGVVVNSKFMRALVQYRNYFRKNSPNRVLADQVISHITDKFPDILTMQYMFRKVKGKLIPYFPSKFT